MENEPYRADGESANRHHYARSAIATVALLILLGLCISAGVWQLGRAAEKQILNIDFAGGTIGDTNQQPVDDVAAAEYRFRMFELSGSYDPERQILLDSMVEQGRNGYQVLTPFRTQDMTVLVNRGWVQASPDRRQLPDTSVGGEQRVILARLNRLPIPGVRLPPPDVQDSIWPRRLLFPTRDQIVANLGYAVADYQLLLDPKATDGYVRDWKAVEIGPERNFGYAMQWFSFALLALIFYIILNVRWNKQKKARQA